MSPVVVVVVLFRDTTVEFIFKNDTWALTLYITATIPRVNDRKINTDSVVKIFIYFSYNIKFISIKKNT